MDEIAQLVSRLDASPGKFSGAMSRLEAADSVETTRQGEWSALEILAHVRASQDIIEPRIFAILARDNPPLPAFDDRQWAEVARYRFQPITETLQSMKLRRNELVRVLKALSPGDWQRQGTHEVRGPLTVLEIARNLAHHEDEHYQQIMRGGTAYADANVENP